jgi:hypothetical protein
MPSGVRWRIWLASIIWTMRSAQATFSGVQFFRARIAGTWGASFGQTLGRETRVEEDVNYSAGCAMPEL